MQCLVEEEEPVGRDHASRCVTKGFCAFRGWSVKVPEGHVGVVNCGVSELGEEECRQGNGSIKEDLVFGPDIGLGEA